MGLNLKTMSASPILNYCARGSLRPAKSRRAQCAVIGAIALVGQRASANTFTWTGGSGTSTTWLTAGNWTPSGPPGGNDVADFSAAGTSTVIYITFSNATNNGTANEAVGEISVDANDTIKRYISDGSKITAGTLQLNGSSGIFLLDNSTNSSNLTLYNAPSGYLTTSLVFNGSGSIEADTGEIVINDQITTSNGGTLTKTGAGILLLAPNSGTNSFTGLNINVGTVDFTTTGIGSSTAIAFTGGTLKYNSAGNTDDVSSQIASSTSAITIDTQANNVVFASSISSTNTGGLTKLGSGSLTLSASNSYTGATTLSAGTLDINNAGAISSGNFNIAGGTVDATNGAITLSGNNTQTWSGNFTFTGTNNLNLGSGAVTLSANRTVTITGGTLTEAGAIGGAFSLTKAGNGTLALTSGLGSSFSGGLFVNAGTVSVSNNFADLGAAPPSPMVEVTLNGGTLATTGSFATASSRSLALGSSGGTFDVAPGTTLNMTNLVTNVTSATGSLSKTDSGTLSLSRGAGNTYSGTTTVSAGTLLATNTVASGGSATGAGSVTVSGTAAGIATSGTLGGTGLITGAVTIGNFGTITAGSGGTTNDTIGTLNTSGGQTWNAGSTYAVKLGTTNGSSDLLIMSGLTQSGATTILVTGLANSNIYGGNSYIIADNKGVADSTAFNTGLLTINTTGTAATGPYGGNGNFSLSEVTDASLGAAGTGLGGEDLILTDTAAPEPTSMILLGVATAPLMLGRRRRPKANASR